MKRFAIAVAALVFSAGATAQISISREGHVTTAAERVRWMQVLNEYDQYCTKENLLRFTEPMQKEFRKAQKGIEMLDLASAERTITLCQEGAKLAKPKEAPVKQPTKGPLAGVGMETSTPRDIYMNVATPQMQQRLLALEKTKDWQLNALPSFSCTKALSLTEQTICNDPYLSLLDKAMSDAYRQALINAKLTGDPEWLQDDQRKWNKKLQTVKFASEIAYRQATRISFLKDDTPNSQIPNW